MLAGIVIDISYFEKFYNASSPAVFAFEVFKSGGWVIIAFIFLSALWHIWVESRQIKWAKTIEYTLLAIDVPKDTKQTPMAVEHIFSTLHGTLSNYDRIEKYWEGKIPVSFSCEIVSVGGYIQFYIRCWSRHRDVVESAVYAQYPEAEIAEVQDYVDSIPKIFPAEGWDAFGTELTLMNKSPYPIRIYTEFQEAVSGDLKDPLLGLLEGMSKLRSGEQLWIQILIGPDKGEGFREDATDAVIKITGAKPKSKQNMLQKGLEAAGTIVSDILYAEAGEGDKKENTEKLANLTPRARKILEEVQMKMRKNVFRTKIRFIYVAQKEVFAKGRTVSTLKGVFGQYTHLDQNGFKIFGDVTPKDDYFWQRNIVFEYLSLFLHTTFTTKLNRVINAYKNRSMAVGAPPFIFNIEELATIFHFPITGAGGKAGDGGGGKVSIAPSVRKTEAKRAEPPTSLPKSFASPGMPKIPVVPTPPRMVPTAPQSKKGEGPITADTPNNLPFID